MTPVIVTGCLLIVGIGVLRAIGVVVRRSFAGMAQYRTHLKGLYLTGASTHPGGGIMGAPGKNAALRILKDSKGSR